MTTDFGRLTGQLAALAGALVLCCSAAYANPKIAVLPVDLTFPRSEEDFYYGVRKPSPEEAKRLEMARDALLKAIADDGHYDVIDIAPIEAEAKAAQPFGDCNGCDVDLAKKLSADFVMTSAVDKISETHLSLNIAIVDVAKTALVRNGSVLIQGNTDEAWLHGVKWLTRNRLFNVGNKQ